MLLEHGLLLDRVPAGSLAQGTQEGVSEETMTRLFPLGENEGCVLLGLLRIKVLESVCLFITLHLSRMYFLN